MNIIFKKNLNSEQLCAKGFKLTTETTQDKVVGMRKHKKTVPRYIILIEIKLLKRKDGFVSKNVS